MTIRPRRLVAAIAWSVLAVLAALGLAVRFQLPPVPVSEWDSWGWLSPALSWVGGTGFHEEYEREWLYGAFLAGSLRLTGSFAGYVVLQQCLGVLAAVFAFATWRTWMSLFPPSLRFDAIASVAGLAAATFLLFSPLALVLELSIRPEAVLACVAFAQLLCVTLFLKFRWHTPRTGLTIPFGSLAVALAYALCVLKPNWLLAMFATTLPVWAGVFGRQPSRFLPAAAGIALAVFLVWLPGKILFLRDGKPRVVLPMTLFTIHADVICRSMEAERTDPDTSADRRAFLDLFVPELRHEMERSLAGNVTYKRLGFDPDFLMYRSTIFPMVSKTLALEKPALAAFCRNEFLHAVVRHPGDYARKVLVQMGWFLVPDDGTFFRKRIELDKLHGASLATLPETLKLPVKENTRDVFASLRASSLAAQAAPLQLAPALPVRDLLRAFARSAPWILAAGLISTALSLALPSLAPFRLAALSSLVILGAPFGNALTVALVHSLDNARYRGSYGPLLLFSLLALSVLTLTLAARSLRHLTGNPSPP